MSNNRELSEFADYLTVDDTTKNVGIGTTLKISAGGIFVGNTEIVRPDGTWGGPNTGLVGAQGAQGAQGFQGAVGAQGAQGSVGAQGAQGAQGYQGAAGSATITNNADNRVITGGTGTNLNGEANLTFDGSRLSINGGGIGDDWGPFNVNIDGSNIMHLGYGTNDDNYFTAGGSGIQVFRTGGTERFRIGSSGQIGLSGANYGTSGQVLTSQGSSSAAQWATPAGGKILQVVQTVKTSTFSTTGTSEVDITGMSVTITPSATTSKILIMAMVGTKTSDSGYNGRYINLKRGSTNIVVGDPSTSRTGATMAAGQLVTTDNYGDLKQTIIYMDSPSTTSATTYKLTTGDASGSSTFYMNRGEGDGTNGEAIRSVSTITAMEIGA